jgi:hypothetical protein
VDNRGGLKADHRRDSRHVSALRALHIREGVQIEQGDKVDFLKNARGETYGSAMEARTPAYEPDLIRSVGDDGKIGYLKKADLDQGTPKSPEEAIQMQNARKDGAGRVLKLYAEDGSTVIGQRLLGKATP